MTFHIGSFVLGAVVGAWLFFTYGLVYIYLRDHGTGKT